MPLRMSALGQKRSFLVGPPNGCCAPKADVRSWGARSPQGIVGAGLGGQHAFEQTLGVVKPVVHDQQLCRLQVRDDESLAVFLCGCRWCSPSNFAGMLFGAVTAYPAVSAAISLPDTGGLLSGGPIEISVDGAGQSCAGNWSGISISADGRRAGKVG